MEFIKIGKKAIWFVLIIVNTYVYTAEVESPDDTKKTWLIQTNDGEIHSVLRKNWKQSLLIQTVREVDKDSGAESNPIILKQINAEQFKQVDDLLQGKKVDGVNSSKAFQLIITLSYFGIDNHIDKIFFNEPVVSADQNFPPVPEEICLSFLQKKLKDKESFAKLRDLVMHNNPSKNLRVRFFEQFGKVSLLATAVQLRSTKVKDKVKAFESYKNLPFKEQQILKKIQQS